MRRWIMGLAVLWLLTQAPAALAVNDPLRFRQWGLTMIEADAAHLTSTGAGATVAVIDTGAQLDHPDLAGRLIPGNDYIDGGTPQDGQGHGTHVAGIIAANADNGIGVDSVAPGAQVLVVRVLDNGGGGNSGDAAAAIDYAVGRGVNVINLSLGSEIPLLGSDRAFDAALDRALDRGVVVVAAAGNSSLPACDQPSGRGRLLCVGAVDRDGNPSFYSNFGLGLGVAAPGGAGGGGPSENILSTYPTFLHTTDPSNPDDRYCVDEIGYCTVAGTSQATPHVAGVAALLVSLGLRGQAVTDRILQTARGGPSLQRGAGIVDAKRAVEGLSRPSSGGGSVSPAPNAPLGSAGRVSIARRLRIRDVLRRGFRVGCTAVGRGSCRVVVRAGRRRIAAGSRAVSVGVPVTVVAKLNRAGRALLVSRKRLTVSVRVTLPGAAPQTRLVKLRR